MVADVGFAPSFLLTFALAELEEGRKNFAAAHEAFSKLIDALSADLTALKRSIDKEVFDSLAALNASYAAQAAGAASRSGGGVGTGTVGGGNQGGEPEMIDIAEVLRGQERERQAKEREVRGRQQKAVDDKEKGAGLVWIMQMRFARRSEVRPALGPCPQRVMIRLALADHRLCLHRVSRAAGPSLPRPASFRTQPGRSSRRQVSRPALPARRLPSRPLTPISHLSSPDRVPLQQRPGRCDADLRARP